MGSRFMSLATSGELKSIANPSKFKILKDRTGASNQGQVPTWDTTSLSDGTISIQGQMRRHFPKSGGNATRNAGPSLHPKQRTNNFFFLKLVQAALTGHISPSKASVMFCTFRRFKSTSLTESRPLLLFMHFLHFFFEKSAL